MQLILSGQSDRPTVDRMHRCNLCVYRHTLLELGRFHHPSRSSSSVISSSWQVWLLCRTLCGRFVRRKCLYLIRLEYHIISPAALTVAQEHEICVCVCDIICFTRSFVLLWCIKWANGKFDSSHSLLSPFKLIRPTEVYTQKNLIEYVNLAVWLHRCAKIQQFSFYFINSSVQIARAMLFRDRAAARLCVCVSVHSCCGLPSTESAELRRWMLGIGVVRYLAGIVAI